ncbi:hypothetical protein N9Z64_01200 [bacterium]|nr:hypothetical protein [bacterium]
MIINLMAKAFFRYSLEKQNKTKQNKTTPTSTGTKVPKENRQYVRVIGKFSL